MRARGAIAAIGAAALAALAAAAAGCGETEAGPAPVKPAYPRSIVVLGIDGMDPQITRRLLAAGQMPNLAALIEKGGLSDLDTTSPPQSAVAWSTIVSGRDPEAHGIFDFVHRDPARLKPYESISRPEPSSFEIDIGPWKFSLGGGEMELLREGRTFWQLLEDAGVPATVVKIPANFPPAPSEKAESLSGMGTPDLLGTNGVFQLFTDDPAIEGPLKGGELHRLDFAGGQRAKSWMTGPVNPTSSDGESMTLEVEIVRDRTRDVALVRLGDQEVILAAGEWSDWLPISFDPGVLGGPVPGMVRLYLRQVRPTVHLFSTPINIDPLDPAMPVSSPERYAADLARATGRYYTQGMPENTKALSSGALNEEEFLQVVDRVMDETEAALDHELSRFRGGLLFVYLSSIDQASHVFYRSMQPDAPEEQKAYADVIPSLYRRVDGWIPRILEKVPKGTELVIMSDHGFAPYHTKVHLNTFLARRGYLTVLPPEERAPGPLGHIDWSQTQAYAYGLNQLFINLEGRERHGVVPPSERDVLLRRIEADLLSLRDPRTGATAITRVDRLPEGPFPDREPDLVIGYRRGYRISDEAALGAVGEEVFEENTDKWSGDHCMDPSSVPGVLAASTPIAAGGALPHLRDITPTILHYFGITPPAELKGRSLIEAKN